MKTGARRHGAAVDCCSFARFGPAQVTIEIKGLHQSWLFLPFDLRVIDTIKGS
jgi:hypothetical protein